MLQSHACSAAQPQSRSIAVSRLSRAACRGTRRRCEVPGICCVNAVAVTDQARGRATHGVCIVLLVRTYIDALCVLHVAIRAAGGGAGPVAAGSSARLRLTAHGERCAPVGLF
jgi:hypothetical protein